MIDDPIAVFQAWHREADENQDCDADRTALATSTQDGRPSVRFVFFRGIREGGFSFFTNYDSRKGRELLGNPFASMAFHWPGLGRQVRIEGSVQQLSSSESDAYWQTRPRESQVSSLVSRQSKLLVDETTFLAEVSRVQESGEPIPRPSNWGGFKIMPTSIEFWTRGEHRRHHRVRYEKSANPWDSTRLYP